MSLAVAETWSERGNAYALSEVHRAGPSLAKLLTLLRPQATDICLDVGTGAGHTAAAFAQYVHSITGLDPAEGMLEAAKNTYPNITFVSGSSDALPFEAASFDLMTARHTLHHHGSVPAFLAEAQRTLKPGGRLGIVDEITPSAELDDWYDRLERLRDPTHNRAYTMLEWQNFVEDSGLTWVCGDSLTYLRLDVAEWINRTTPQENLETVWQMFQDAPDAAKAAFSIAYEADKAITFDMPLGIILISKP
ncbi:MAG: class I SAM-dependent methyltransferase [Deinococcota bacterium]